MPSSAEANVLSLILFVDIKSCPLSYSIFKYKSNVYRAIALTKTRDGEKEIAILTNLPKTDVSAKMIAELYRKRWNIETMFQELEAHLHSEVNTLGYPKAALFSFCIALVAYNVLAVVKAALRAQHGEETIENELFGYYLAGNIARTYDGMIIALPSKLWQSPSWSTSFFNLQAMSI